MNNTDKKLYYPNKEERAERFNQMANPSFDAHKELFKDLKVASTRETREPIRFANPPLS